MDDWRFLRRNYLFSHLSDDALLDLGQALLRRSLQPNEVLFNIGDPGDKLYIVAEGQIAIYAPDPDNPGGEQPVRLFEPGDALGEMALIDHKPRSLSARAAGASRVLALNKDDFRRFAASDSDLAFAIMNGLSDRIRYTTTFLSEVRDWIGRVTQGDYDDADFAEQASPGSTGGASHQDDMLSSLAAEFAQMAAFVKKREESLREEIAVLKIQLDDEKRKQSVSSIMNSDSFQHLKEQARQFREENLESDD